MTRPLRSPRAVPPVVLAQPDPRPVADLGARAAAAGLHPGDVRDRPAVLRRLQPEPQPGQRHDTGQGPAWLLPVLLAHPPDLALPAHPGRPRHPGADAGADPAVQAVVGAAEAVRVAAAALVRARAGTVLAVPARRRRGVRVRDGDLEHPDVVPVPHLLLHAALLRCVGVHRRLRHPRGGQVPGHDQGAAQPELHRRRCGRTSPARARSRRTPGTWPRSPPPPRRSPGAACWPSPARVRPSSRCCPWASPWAGRSAGPRCSRRTTSPSPAPPPAPSATSRSTTPRATRGIIAAETGETWRLSVGTDDQAGLRPPRC